MSKPKASKPKPKKVSAVEPLGRPFCGLCTMRVLTRHPYLQSLHEQLAQIVNADGGIAAVDRIPALLQHMRSAGALPVRRACMSVRSFNNSAVRSWESVHSNVTRLPRLLCGQNKVADACLSWSC